MSFIESFNAGMTAGWSVTVSGVSFGASLDTTPTSRLGLSECGTAAWLSVTSVACFLTRGGGVEHEATVTAVGVVGTRTSTFSYDGTTDSDAIFAILHDIGFSFRSGSPS